MVEQSDVIQQRRDAAGPVTRLVEFLRKLATTRNAAVLDFTDHEKVWWLNDRPAMATLAVDAEADDVIFSLDPVASEPPPRTPEELAGWLDPSEVNDSSVSRPAVRQFPPPPDDGELLPVPFGVQAAFDRWVGTWLLWAEADRLIDAQRTWYENLSKAHQQLDQHSDEFELVVAAGLLGWKTPSGRAVRTHLLTTRAQLTVEVETGQIRVIVDPDAVTRICDRDLLTSDDGFEAFRAQPVRDELRETIPCPLGGDTKGLVERWRTLALDRSRPYEHDAWEPLSQIDETPELRFAPALVLRRRDAASLLGFYDAMLEVLSGPNAEAPLGLAQLLAALEPEDRLAWLEHEGDGDYGVDEDPLFPLPSNDEQRQIIDRLRHDSGVVVQGPPGTGKSHSIANLISALLAQGMRVLVTSQKAQALRVLREKLPDEVAELCVSMTDLSRGGSAELNRSVNAIAEQFGNYNPAVQAAQIAELVRQRDHERSRVADITDRLRALRESESYQHPEVATGYAGTLGSISRKLRENDGTLGWIPVPLSAEAPNAAPLTVAEFGELRALLAAETPERRRLGVAQLPPVDEFPPANQVRAWVVAEAAASSQAKEAATEQSAELAALSDEWRAWLAQTLDGLWVTFDRSGLERDDRTWAPNDWRSAAAAAAIAGQEPGLWEQLAEVATQARDAQAALRTIGLRNVVLPAMEPTGPSSRGVLLAAAEGLSVYLRGGGKLRRVGAKPVQKAADPLLVGATIDGVAPSTPELLDVLVAQLRIEVTVEGLTRHWAGFGLNLDPTTPLNRRTSQLVEAVDALEAFQQVRQACAVLTTELARAGLRIPLARIADLVRLTEASQALAAQSAADAATAAIAQQVERLDQIATAAPDVAPLARALAGRDADSYEQLLLTLAVMHEAQVEQRRCDALRTALHAAHPALAELLASTPTDGAWDNRVATLPDAWAFARARTFFEGQRQPGLDAELDSELTDAVARFEAATGRLASARAWQHTLARMTQKQSQALQVYRQAMSDRGQGKGRYAARYEKAARQAMFEARGAVPAWIMPLPEVLETVPPDRNSFDVVIVDEASQASLEALFLLWLAPRVIVVGDDRQCTPSQVSHGELQPIFDSLDEYLPDIPEYLRVAFTPRSSLFSLLTTRFGAVIRLREHFRCMPEIIGWSSTQFYRDSPLIPLRQFGADRLEPLKLRYVQGAFTEGTGTMRIRNPIEAEAIADQIAECLDDPAYDGKTFGVVVLQGRAQIPLIQDVLHTRIPASAWEQRRLRIGNPPDFQGDERDVIFISMVVANPPRALTRLDDQRRFNVAASRARDQLWVFSSVTLDLYGPSDLRHSLVAYMANPPEIDLVEGLDNVTDNEPHPMFDSLFEQRVFGRIRARGYHVVPQFEVNGRRIDLVVTGANGKLAVECDGEAWHSSPEQRANDLHRERELKRAGWRFWRVRDSEFSFDPDRALDSLWETLTARGIHPNDTLPASSTVVGDDTGDEAWAPMQLSEEEGSELDDGDDDPIDYFESAPAFRPAPRAASSESGPTTIGGQTTRPRAAGGPTSSEVRAWARGEGLAVGERGRLHPLVIAAWNDAHPDRTFR